MSVSGWPPKTISTKHNEIQAAFRRVGRCANSSVRHIKSGSHMATLQSAYNNQTTRNPVKGNTNPAVQHPQAFGPIDREKRYIPMPATHSLAIAVHTQADGDGTST